MEKNLSRKQQEIRDRELQILDHAEALLYSQGFHAVTMDKLADMTACSKGTVYQHFANKEDVCAAVCLRNSRLLLNFFERAATFLGNSREQLLAMFEAHRLYVCLYPTQFRNFQAISSSAYREKIPENRRHELDEREAQMFGMVKACADSAIANGELKLRGYGNTAELVFSLWAQSHGHLYLATIDVNFAKLGIHRPHELMLNSFHLFLDGLNWHPLSTEFDYGETLARLREEVFSQEFAAASHIPPG